MNLVIGILMFVLGIFALVAWFAELIPFLKGVLVCALLLSGFVCIVVGFTKKRALAARTKAANDQPSLAESNAEI